MAAADTIAFVTENSESDSVPFGTRLCWQSLVCYTFIRKPEAKQRPVLLMTHRPLVFVERRKGSLGLHSDLKENF